MAAELDSSVPPILTFHHVIQQLFIEYLLYIKHFSMHVAYSNGQDR